MTILRAPGARIISTALAGWGKTALNTIRAHIADPSEFYIRGARILTYLLYDLHHSGVENIPQQGGAILICNHVSFMDGMVINACLNRRVRYVIDERIYHLPMIHYFMKLNGAVPIKANRASVSEALDIITEGLKAGDVFCIFPEGKITYTGNLSRFRSGTEWMLKRVPVPVIPMALRGLWGSCLSRKDKGRWYRYIPRSFRRRVTLRIGTPVPGETLTTSHMQRLVIRLLNQPDTF